MSTGEYSSRRLAWVLHEDSKLAILVARGQALHFTNRMSWCADMLTPFFVSTESGGLGLVHPGSIVVRVAINDMIYCHDVFHDGVLPVS